MEHGGNSVPLTEAVAANMTTAAIRARKRERIREKLATNQPFLGSRCPEAQRRLYDFSVQLREHETIPRDGLREAAETVLVTLHDGLRPLEATILEPSVAFELFYAKRYAIRALELVLGSRMEAKRVDVALAGGHPLTVCSGPHRTQKIQTVRGIAHMPLWWMGCRIVFPDSTNLRGGGRAWKDWCPDCAPEVSQPGRRLAARHARYVTGLTAPRPQ